MCSNADVIRGRQHPLPPPTSKGCTGCPRRQAFVMLLSIAIVTDTETPYRMIINYDNNSFQGIYELSSVLQVCDDDIVIRLSQFRIIFMDLSFIEKHDVSEIGFCHRLQVESL
jgi:hypothetical protein